MRKTMILVGFLALAPFAKGQLLLEALEGGQNEKCLERVKDKHYGDGVHNYIYCAIQGPNGKKWLNLNLGAEYAKENSPHFNPEAQPKDENDWRAFGSLFQEGRDADGHELVTYRRGTEFWQIARTNRADYWKGNFTSQLILDYDQLLTSGSPISKFDAWGGSMYNNPCPNGYRVMNRGDIESLLTGDNISHSGHYIGTTLVTNPSNENIKLMFPPSHEWRLNNTQQLQDIVDGHFVDASARLNRTSDDIGGTSSLWTVYMNKTEAESTTKKRALKAKRRFNTVWETPDIGTIDSPSVVAITDIGVFHNGEEFQVGIGTTYNIWTTNAIRCVEK